MPTIDLFVSQYALPEAELAALAGRIAEAVTAEEGYAGSRFATSVTWTYVHELPPGRLLVGIEPCHAPVWHMEVTSPVGSLDAAAKARLGREVARLVLEAKGMACDPAQASRVWCLFHGCDRKRMVRGRACGLGRMTADPVSVSRICPSGLV